MVSAQNMTSTTEWRLCWFDVSGSLGVPMLRFRLLPARITLNGLAQAWRDEWSRCRALGASCLKDRRVRWVLKAGLDFLCGAIAFGVGIALSDGVATFGAAKLTVMAASVGALLVIAEAVGG